ncbi:unnamed protein product, partial [Staurois parvus]
MTAGTGSSGIGSSWLDSGHRVTRHQVPFGSTAGTASSGKAVGTDHQATTVGSESIGTTAGTGSSGTRSSGFDS